MNSDHADIARELGRVGVRFEQWEASKPVPGASQDEVIAAYRADIDRLKSDEGYQAVDVISLTPDIPTAPRCARSSSTSTRIRKTKCVSSSPARPVHAAIGDKVYETLCVQR